jgi:threonine dehydratase
LEGELAISLADFEAAQQRINPYIKNLPLLHSDYLSELTQADVWLKLESLQPTGSFKIRGALNKISSLTAVAKHRGIVTASAGNHALGVAYAIQSLGHIQADIFVPETAPQAKLAKLRRFPVTLHLAGQTYDEAQQAAAQFQQQRGAVEIPAYDDTAVMTGQGTIGLEIWQALPHTDIVLVPIGGGGLIAGISTAVSGLAPHCQVVGVQPTASPAAQLSFAHGRAIDPYAHEATIADGLAGGFGARPFALLQNNPPQIELASEWEIRQAVYTLVAQQQLICEPSGAIAIAPLWRGDWHVAGKTVVCVLSGGNLDPGLLREILIEFG